MTSGYLANNVTVVILSTRFIVRITVGIQSAQPIFTQATGVAPDVPARQVVSWSTGRL